MAASALLSIEAVGSPGAELEPAAPSRQFTRRFRRHRLAVASVAVLALLLAAAILAPILPLQDPYAIDLYGTAQPPSPSHWLGTDETGRDVFSRLIYGARVSLSVGLVAVSIYTVIGLVVGSVASYAGGWVDSLLMRATDVVMCFPSLIIIITVVSFAGPSIYNVMAAIGLLGWPHTARLIRGQMLTLREQEFVQAAHALGVPDMAIVLRHMLPNAIFPIVVSSTFGVATAILTEAGLSFLGLGVQPPAASWGGMLNAAQSITILESMPWLWLPPGLMIVLAVLSINFVGDGLRDALDPRMSME
jgi:peptide/nickel transport system permease protein